MFNAPGRQLQHTMWLLSLHFDVLNLSNGNTEQSARAWCDPADHSQVYPVPFYCCEVLPKDLLPDVDDYLGGGDAGWILLNLLDPSGAVIGYFASNGSLWPLSPVLPHLFWDDHTPPPPLYDPYVNPLGYASCIEYLLHGTAGHTLTKVLPDPFHVRCVGRPGVNALLDGPPILMRSHGIVFPGDPPQAYVDLSLYFGSTTAVVLGATFNGYGYDSPPRKYSRWRLEIESPVPPPPYDIVQVFAEGPVLPTDFLGPADTYESEWDPATKRFYNPLKPGWSEETSFRIIVW